MSSEGSNPSPSAKNGLTKPFSAGAQSGRDYSKGLSAAVL